MNDAELLTITFKRDNEFCWATINKTIDEAEKQLERIKNLSFGERTNFKIMTLKEAKIIRDKEQEEFAVKPLSV